MLRLLYYHYKKSGKISTKKGGGLIICHGRIIRILQYTKYILVRNSIQEVVRNIMMIIIYITTAQMYG